MSMYTRCDQCKRLHGFAFHLCVFPPTPPVKANKRKMNKTTLYGSVLFRNIFLLTFSKDVILLVKLSALQCFVGLVVKFGLRQL